MYVNVLNVKINWLSPLIYHFCHKEGGTQMQLAAWQGRLGLVLQGVKHI